MSRLDSFIRRMQAQREILNQTSEKVKDLPGPILEIGLGNGRTYDHLRELMPEREIFVFDRAVNAHPSCIPEDKYLLLGEVEETLANCSDKIEEQAVLIHSDIGVGDPVDNVNISRWLSPLIDERTAAQGIVVCNMVLTLPNFDELPLPDGIKPGRYFVYQKRA